MFGLIVKFELGYKVRELLEHGYNRVSRTLLSMSKCINVRVFALLVLIVYKCLFGCYWTGLTY